MILFYFIIFFRNLNNSKALSIILGCLGIIMLQMGLKRVQSEKFLSILQLDMTSSLVILLDGQKTRAFE